VNNLEEFRGFLEKIFSEALVLHSPDKIVFNYLHELGEDLSEGVVEKERNELVSISRQTFISGGIDLVATGKSAIQMAEGALRIFGDSIKRGLVITNQEVKTSQGEIRSSPAEPKSLYGSENTKSEGNRGYTGGSEGNTKQTGGTGAFYKRCVAEPENFKIVYSSHPIPDEKSRYAGEVLLDFCKKSSKEGTLLYLLSGGTSSMVNYPRPPLTTAEKGEISGILMKNGIEIGDLNAVRSYFSQVKNGGLLNFIQSDTVINLILSDVLDNDPSVIGSGMLSYRLISAKRVVEIIKSFGGLRRKIASSTPENRGKATRFPSDLEKVTTSSAELEKTATFSLGLEEEKIASENLTKNKNPDSEKPVTSKAISKAIKSAEEFRGDSYQTQGMNPTIQKAIKFAEKFGDTKPPARNEVFRRIIDSNQAMVEDIAKLIRKAGFNVAVNPEPISGKIENAVTELINKKNELLQTFSDFNSNFNTALSSTPNPVPNPNHIPNLTGKDNTTPKIHPNAKPFFYISGGEVGVQVRGSGKGGRNTEFAMRMAKEIQSGDMVFMSVGSDGIDGSSQFAGAIVDSETYQKSISKGLNFESYLHNSDSGTWVEKLGCGIKTGQTGVNLADLIILVLL